MTGTETEQDALKGHGAIRKIVHVDMDSYFAAVEMRDDPRLRGRPIAVGSAGPRGVVATASYEARKFGVKSAMASVTAQRLCPDLVFVPPRFDAYRAVTEQIRAIFLSHTPLVEPLSLDEAYLDVTTNLQGLPYASRVARYIKEEIRDVTGLTASAGVSLNKFCAKIASDYRKPDGLFVVLPEHAEAFVGGLRIERFHGIGPATAEKMHAMGIMTGADLKRRPLDELKAAFGKSGPWFYGISRGIDHRPVNPERIRKSVGAENTFMRDLYDEDELAAEMEPLALKAWKGTEKHGLKGRTVTLKVKYDDFVQATRSRTLSGPVSSLEELDGAVRALLRSVLPTEKGIRLLGVTISGFEGDDELENGPQMALPL